MLKHGMQRSRSEVTYDAFMRTEIFFTGFGGYASEYCEVEDASSCTENNCAKEDGVYGEKEKTEVALEGAWSQMLGSRLRANERSLTSNAKIKEQFETN